MYERARPGGDNDSSVRAGESKWLSGVPARDERVATVFIQTAKRYHNMEYYYSVYIYTHTRIIVILYHVVPSQKPAFYYAIVVYSVWKKKIKILFVNSSEMVIMCLFDYSRTPSLLTRINRLGCPIVYKSS